MAYTTLRRRAVRVFGALTIGALLAGCTANPIVQWVPPDIPKHVKPGPTNLDVGNAYANSAIKTYTDIQRDEALASGQLTSGLVGAGVLGLALAASTAHRDALLALGLVGGGAYAIGGMNLSKTRLLVLQSGIEAMTCAKRAVIPLTMTLTDQTQLNDYLAALAAARYRLPGATEAVRRTLTFYKAGNPSKPLIELADATLAASNAGSQAATSAQTDGRALAIRALNASPRLAAAVDRIHNSVNRALLISLSELSDVRKALESLSGYAAAIAPGTDKLLASGIAAREKQSGLKSGLAVRAKADKVVRPGEPELEEAIANLEMLIDAQQMAAANVQVIVGSQQDTATALGDLSDCGIAAANGPLAVNFSAMQFAAGTEERKSLEIRGGMRPYSAQLLDPTPAGMTLITPRTESDTRVEVLVGSAVKKTEPLTLQISDKSTPPNLLNVTISVVDATTQSAPAPAPNARVPANPAVPASGAPGAKDPGAKAGAGAAGATATVEQLIAAINALKSPALVLDNGIKLSVETKAASTDKKSITVGLSCVPVPEPAACLKSSVIRARLVNAAKPDGSAAALASSVTLNGVPAACFCP